MKKIIFSLIVSLFIFSSAFAQDVSGGETEAQGSGTENSVENSTGNSSETSESVEASDNSEKSDNSAEESEKKSEGKSEAGKKKSKKNRNEFALNPFKSDLNVPGDQYIKVALMPSFPMNFGGSFPLFNEGKIKLGGAGELGYHRFITSWFAVGVDVGFGYNPTLEKNVFTWVPILATATIQPTLGRFEFPLTMALGMAYESYLKRHYFPGFIMKPQFGIYYRALPGWSFGAEFQFAIVPQWYDDSSRNFTGYFCTFAVGARYHF